MLRESIRCRAKTNIEFESWCNQARKKAKVTMPVINTSASRPPSPDPDESDDVDEAYGLAQELGLFEEAVNDTTRISHDATDSSIAPSVEDRPHEEFLIPATDVSISRSNIDSELAKIYSETSDGKIPSTRESSGIKAGSSRSIPLFELGDNTCVGNTLDQVLSQPFDEPEPEPEPESEPITTIGTSMYTGEQYQVPNWLTYT